MLPKFVLGHFQGSRVAFHSVAFITITFGFSRISRLQEPLKTRCVPLAVQVSNVADPRISHEVTLCMIYVDLYKLWSIVVLSMEDDDDSVYRMRQLDIAPTSTRL